MMDQVFFLLVVGLSLSLIGLLLEKTHHKLDLEAREGIKKQVFVAIRSAKNQKIALNHLRVISLSKVMITVLPMNMNLYSIE